MLEKQKNEVGKQYAVLPAFVRYDKRLNASEKIFYSELLAHCDVEKKCYETNGYFADLYSVNKSSISHWIKGLEQAGYIEVDIEYKEGSREVVRRTIKVLGGLYE